VSSQAEAGSWRCRFCSSDAEAHGTGRLAYDKSMFTGIIERTGTVVSLTEHGAVKRLTVAAPEIAGRLKEGDSLAVSGVCLTALEVNPEYFHADLAAETLARTSLGSLAAGALVNLELPTAAGAPLGGHIVQGHVDGTGTLVSLEPVTPLTTEMTAGELEAARETTDWWLTVRVPEHVRGFLVEKGSVAIEGISLTIAKTTIPEGVDTISIAILPLTYWRTNLHTLSAGAPVNVEADVLMKLAVAQMAEAEKKAEFEITEGWLVANGF
jgi:riboflavin synthase